MLFVLGTRYFTCIQADSLSRVVVLFEPRCEKTGLRDFRPGPTQTGLYSYRRWIEASNFGFRKKRGCTIRMAKTKALISCAVTAQLICVFVFAYEKAGSLITTGYIFLVGILCSM